MKTIHITYKDKVLPANGTDNGVVQISEEIQDVTIEDINAMKSIVDVDIDKSFGTGTNGNDLVFWEGYKKRNKRG